jgi:hypothetical protein
MTSYSGDGHTLDFDEVGAGKDALLLVHGHPFDCEQLTRCSSTVPASNMRMSAPRRVRRRPFTLQVPPISVA